jgi:hypothetical protein
MGMGHHHELGTTHSATDSGDDLGGGRVISSDRHRAEDGLDVGLRASLAAEAGEEVSSELLHSAEFEDGERGRREGGEDMSEKGER